MRRQVLDRRLAVVTYSLTPKRLDFRKVSEGTQNRAEEWTGDTATV